jgi:DNA-directed RNA polymerase specialized sigma24 family protein
MSGRSTPQLFPPTQWSLLQRIRTGSEEDSHAALEMLCRAYWHPLYCVARRRQLSEHDAKDAVQGFFARILRQAVFAIADETVGRLRQLLLVSFENYCNQLWRSENCQKRGGGVEHVAFSESFDSAAAEDRYHRSSAGTTVEALYNQEWAHAVLDRALRSLRSDYAGRGWQERYDLLVRTLLQQEDEASLRQLAAGAGMSPGALRVTLHRMRRHYRDKIERELATTLGTDDPALIRQEMAELFKAFI